MQRISVVTYNLKTGGRGRAHWEKILDDFAPDIFLAQESAPPSEHVTGLDPQCVWKNARRPNGDGLGWGSAVYLREGPPVALELPKFGGWVSALRRPDFLCPDGMRRSLIVASVHNPTGYGAYQAALDQVLDVLAELRTSDDFLIGGDFNVEVSPLREAGRLEQRMTNDFGLFNCWRAANSGQPPAQTLRWSRNKATPYHIDGIFAPLSWAPFLTSCTVMSGAVWDELSDHNPVVATFAGAEPAQSAREHALTC